MEGVAKLAAGGDAAAAVDCRGALWMWGRVDDATEGSSLPPVKSAAGQAPLPCFNAFEAHPVLIPGLSPVEHVALGSHHVLVATAQ